MPAKLFSELQDQLAYKIMGKARTGLSAEQTAIVKDRINQAQERIYEAHKWAWARKRRYIVTTAKYATGTVTLTQYSTTVTGSGTTFTSAMVGRYLVYNSIAYKIRTYTSATVITLEVPFVNTTVAGASYNIYEPEYILPYDVREIVKKSIRQIGQGTSLSFISEIEFMTDYPNPYDAADPPTKYRLPEYTDSAYYSTGTVTTTAAVAVTGSGTSWDDKMIGRAFRISGQSEVYEISDVTSTTALTLKKAYGGTTGAGQSYFIDPSPCLKIWLYPMPTLARGIEFWYFQKPYPLINLTDISEMPADLHDGILYGAEWLWHHYEGDDPQVEALSKQNYDEFLFLAKKKHRISQDQTISLKPHDDYVLQRW